MSLRDERRAGGIRIDGAGCAEHWGLGGGGPTVRACSSTMDSLQNKTLKVILLTALKYTCISKKKKLTLNYFFCVCCLQWPVHGLFCVSLTGMGMDGKGHRDPASTSRSWLSHAVFVVTYQAALHLFLGGLSTFQENFHLYS